MHFVKDKPMFTIHRSSGTDWQIIDAENIEMTQLPRDTRPISQIPITEFVKPMEHIWIHDEVKLADDQLAKAVEANKKWIESMMEMQSVDREKRAEEFKEMVMGHWHSDSKPYYITAKQQKPDDSALKMKHSLKGMERGELCVLGMGRQTGKSMLTAHIMKQRAEQND